MIDLRVLTNGIKSNGDYLRLIGEQGKSGSFSVITWGDTNTYWLSTSGGTGSFKYNSGLTTDTKSLYRWVKK